MKSMSIGVFFRVALVFALLCFFCTAKTNTNSLNEIHLQTNTQSIEASQSENIASEEKNKKPLLAVINGKIASVLFFDVSFGLFKVKQVDENGQVSKKTVSVPLLIWVIFLGALFCTFFFKFINISALKHSLDIIRGKYDDPKHKGEISHFQALTSALSATIGLGNIAGVAVAIYTGGPGAVFWMIVLAFLGMSIKFASCSLALMYRKTDADGRVYGGPMYYLEIGFKELFKNKAIVLLGSSMAIIYAICIIGASFGAGNMFQINQMATIIVDTFQVSEAQQPFAFRFIAVVMIVATGLVTLGGIKRIGKVTSKVVPLMCIVYVAASLYIIVVHIDQLASTIGLIVTMAFTKNAAFGGFVGVLIMGFKRAAFSSEIGLGSAAIAHASAKTDHPIREGLVGMVGPMIDIFVCSMTALVIVITGTWDGQDSTVEGIKLTKTAYETTIGGFGYVLSIAIILFAYSTMISWAYYGEKGWAYFCDKIGFLNTKRKYIYHVVFLCFIYIGATNSFTHVIDFADLMILSIAFPNIIGVFFLAKKIKSELDSYMSKLKKGEMKKMN